VRGFLIGLFVLFFGVVSALSLRPGGLRNQLRNVARRFRLALILAGIYLACSTALRIAFPSSAGAEVAMVALAAVLGGTFLVMGQERQLDRR